MGSQYNYDSTYLKRRPARKNNKPSTGKKQKESLRERQNVNIGSVDITITLVVIILVLFGIVMVFSSSYTMASNRREVFGSQYYFLIRNAVFAAIGFAAMFALSRFSVSIWRNFVWILYFATLVMLVLVASMGTDVHGVSRWLAIPIIGGFQPSEVAKVAIIFTIAHLADKYPAALKSWFNIGIFCAIVGIVVVLVMLPGGFSNGLIIATIGLGLIFVASPYVWRLIIPGTLFAGSAAAYLYISMLYGLDFRGARIRAWLNPWDYPDTTGFQTIQSLYAIATGGWFGKGIGESDQVSFLPEPMNDMIFAIIVEELGLLGALVILAMFGILIWRGIVVAMRVPDTFSSLVAIGVVFLIASQVIINVGVVTNTIPNTGVTLPFISYGGTSLVVTMALCGILLSISRYTRDN